MRALFTSQPAAGHLHPLIPLARAAREAGHEVGFAVAAASCLGLEKLGFSAYPAGVDNNDPAVARLIAEGMRLNGLEPGWAVTNLFAGACAERMIPDLLAIVERWRPDVMVSEITEFASWVVAEKCRIPRAMVPFGIYLGFEMLDALGCGPALEALRRRVGLDPGRETLHSQPFLLFAPPRYQPAHIPLPANGHLFRPVVFDQSGDESLPDWLQYLPDRPLVYATLGTVYNETAGALEATIEAVREENLDLVVTVGRNRDPASLGPLPANVRAERYVPQSLLLPHCDAVVCHGGYGTVLASLCHGLPMVLTPLGADQPLHAGRCQELGVALVVDQGELVPRRMREAIHQILADPGYTERARAMREEMAELPGIDQAVRLLERLAATG